MNHLGANDFQRILEKGGDMPGGGVVSHLEGCSQCRENYARYRRFYNCLGVDTVPALSPDFAGRVMNAVMNEPRVEKEIAPNPSVLIWAFAFVSGGVLISLIDWQAATNTLLIDKTRYLKWLDAIISLPAQIIPQFLNTPAILVGATALLGVALLDYLIRHRSNRPSTFVV